MAPVAPFVAGAVTAGAATAPILFGNNIQRQEDLVATGKKDKVDVDAALRYFLDTALEGVADKILLGGMLRPLGKSIFTRTTKEVLLAAATEAGLKHNKCLSVVRQGYLSTAKMLLQNTAKQPLQEV